MIHSRLFKSAVALGACAAVGTIGGLAASAAAPSHSNETHGTRDGADAQGPATRLAPGGMVAFKIGMGGPPVHAVLTVPNNAGDGFDTVTQDSGTARSVSGQNLTIVEGTDKATYATPTLTIPADATVERNFQSAKLSDIQTGDHVDVSSSSDGRTSVFAVDSAHWPPKPPRFMKQGGPPAPPPGGPTGSAGVVLSDGYRAP